MSALRRASTATGAADLIVRELDGPGDLLDLHAAWPRRYPYLLESVASDGARNFIDVLFAVDGAWQGFDDGALEALDEAWRRECTAPVTDAALPFRGGWFLYLGYELAACVEPSLELPSFGVLPRLIMHRAPAALLRERRSGRVTAIAERGAEALLERLVEDAGRAATRPTPGPAPVRTGALREQDERRFLDAVRRARDYIAAGDIFQANLSRRWDAALAAGHSPADVYRRLRTSNPSPFAGIADFGSAAIVSSSPERLLRVAGGRAETRPIAGTRPRGASAHDDTALRDELFASDKERAEHVMLIDLERNDLGRICKPGTVRVDEYMVLESYAHVHHIVSNVSGELRDGVSPAEAVRAVFPGGTITGCPKVRCMQIIAELEGEARGPYTGSFGYLNRDGSLDLNILIRTLLVESGRITLRAGGGIVADSEPRKELAETRAKARGLLLALDAGH